MQFGQLALDELSRAMQRGWAERDFRVSLTLQEERAGVEVLIPEEELRPVLEE